MNVDIDFGTYHHSTPNRSKAIRKHAEKTFSRLLRPLYPSRRPLRVLDAGCGLGFLMFVVAKCFPKARITGVDVFRRGSMSAISVHKAENNMESLEIAARTSFVKHDLTAPMELDARYDLVVSNLVFHNMRRKRFDAYTNVFDVLKRGGFFVIGDLFPHDKADMDYLRERSTLIREIDRSGSGPWAYKIKVLKKSK